MTYARVTPIYQLESPAYGERLESSSEQRIVQIIENQLYGNVRAHSGGHGVIRQGNFSLLAAGDGTYGAYLLEHKASGKPVVEGFINQIYVYTVNGMQWNGLLPNSTYWLGVRLVEDGNSSSLQYKDVETWSSISNTIPSDGILLATVTIDGSGNGTFDTSPDGQITIPIWGNHISNNTNPHGTLLFQDNLVCSGLSVLSSLKYSNLQVDNFTISGSSVISGNITILGNLVLSGNCVVHGNVTYNLVRSQNMDIPGRFTVSELIVSSGLDVYSTSVFRSNVRIDSGITVDGVDLSNSQNLYGGNNADSLHGHVLGSLSVGSKPLFFSPEYPNTISSGISTSGILTATRMYDNNYYYWYSYNNISGSVNYLVSRIYLPQDFESLDSVSLSNGIGPNGILSGSNINTYIYDKNNTELLLSPNNLQNTTITTNQLTVSGGQLLPGTNITIVNRMLGHSGVPVLIGDMSLNYVPVQGEKIVFDWNISGVGNHLDGLRVAPADLKIEKVLTSQIIGLSGNSIVSVNVSDTGSEPINILSEKPNLSFGDTGSSFVSQELNPIGLYINRNQLISVSSEQVASGTSSVTVQLITHRI